MPVLMKKNGGIITNSSGERIVFIKSNPDEDYVVSTKKKTPRIKKPPFMAIAGGAFMIDKDKSLLQIIGRMTPAERWFFLYIEARMDQANNIAIVKSNELTKTQIKYKVCAYKTLYQQGLVKKIKREHYMINPEMIIAFDDDIYTAMVTLWEALP
jgi:hypothetical protein